MNRSLEIISRVVERRLTYLTPEKLSGLIAAIERVDARGVRGDLAEFGIALGGSAICIASRLGAERNFYGFDNFEMIPPPQALDGERPNRRYDVIKSGRSGGIAGERYYGYVENRFAVVTQTFDDFGLPVDGKRICLVKGLFEDTLPGHLMRPIAFAHIDCDWYAPVMFCLQHLYPLLPVGGTVVVDDYRHWEGCTKATDEFVAAHPVMVLEPAATHATLVKQSS